MKSPQNLVLGVSVSRGVSSVGFVAPEVLGASTEPTQPSTEAHPQVQQSSGGLFGAIGRFFGAIFGFIFHIFNR